MSVDYHLSVFYGYKPDEQTALKRMDLAEEVEGIPSDSAVTIVMSGSCEDPTYWLACKESLREEWIPRDLRSDCGICVQPRVLDAWKNKLLAFCHAHGLTIKLEETSFCACLYISY